MPRPDSQYRIVFDPCSVWTSNSTLNRCEIELLLDDDSLYIGTRFERGDGRVFEVRGKGDDGLCLAEVVAA